QTKNKFSYFLYYSKKFKFYMIFAQFLSIFFEQVKKLSPLKILKIPFFISLQISGLFFIKTYIKKEISSKQKITSSYILLDPLFPNKSIKGSKNSRVRIYIRSYFSKEQQFWSKGSDICYKSLKFYIFYVFYYGLFKIQVEIYISFQFIRSCRLF
ncbi:hypothetical protein IMG5_144030, partial [Ichthyophthirius multifiliis]